MKIIFDHNNGRVDDDKIFCEVFCLPQGESNDELLELGWLPYPSMKIPFWYQSKSCRILPHNISLSYKRKKIISEMTYRILDYSTNKPEVDSFFYNYFLEKSFDIKDSYDETSENPNIEVMEMTYRNQIVGYVRFECFETNILGYETAYLQSSPKLSLGKTAILLLSQEVLLRNKKYLYIYESYNEHFPYKLEISGSQYWEGEKWV